VNEGVAQLPLSQEDEDEYVALAVAENAENCFTADREAHSGHSMRS
jgi:hypothetical protein